MSGTGGISKGNLSEDATTLRRCTHIATGFVKIFSGAVSWQPLYLIQRVDFSEGAAVNDIWVRRRGSESVPNRFVNRLGYEYDCCVLH